MPAPAAGETLHAQVSAAGASPASSFRWQRCVLDVCTTIAGEHTADLHLTVADLHTKIRVVVTREDGQRLTATTATTGTLTAVLPVPAEPAGPAAQSSPGTLPIMLTIGPVAVASGKAAP